MEHQSAEYCAGGGSIAEFEAALDGFGVFLDEEGGEKFGRRQV